MNLYEMLLNELRHARKLMILHYGRPEHRTYRQLVRLIESEIKALNVGETVSA